MSRAHFFAGPLKTRSVRHPPTSINFGRALPNFGQHWPTSATLWPNSANLGTPEGGPRRCSDADSARGLGRPSIRPPLSLSASADLMRIPLKSCPPQHTAKGNTRQRAPPRSGAGESCKFAARSGKHQRLSGAAGQPDTFDMAGFSLLHGRG